MESHLREGRSVGELAAAHEARPHRALGRQTPREVYDALVKAAPQAKVETHFRIRHDKIDKGGKLTQRFESRLLHIGMGARFKGLPVVLLVADRDVRVVSVADSELLRHLTIDPSRDYPAAIGLMAVYDVSTTHITQ